MGVARGCLVSLNVISNPQVESTQNGLLKPVKKKEAGTGLREPERLRT